MALIPLLCLYPMWTLAGMVLAHGPDRTTALVSDMAALAKPRQGIIHHAHPSARRDDRGVERR